jgi:protein-S-isoprenylcysteine O-methyltransferase Ste14
VNPLYLHDAAAHDLVEWSLIAWVAGEFLFRLRNLGGRNDFDWSLLVMVGSIVLAVNLGFSFEHQHATVLGGGWVPVALGTLIFWSGVALRFWAIVTLGRFFTFTVSIQEGHRVVRSGPYRTVRHPSYTGLLLALIGLGIALDSWLSILALVVVPLIGVLIRIRVEEVALAGALGEDYTDYAAQTRRLVPGVW